MFAQTVHVENRNDEVKLSGALAKLLEEDPSISVEHDQSTQQMLLWGQGDQHLKIAAARLKEKYGVSIELQKPKVPTRRPSGNRRPSTRATRNSPGAMASSAM